MKVIRWMFVLFAVIGIGLLAGGAWATARTRSFLARAVETQGTVVDNLWRESSDGSGGVYHPVVRFRAQDGEEIEFISGTGSFPPSHRVREAVAVVYDPANPGGASIRSFFDQWLLAMILFGIGGVFSTIGIGALLWLRPPKDPVEAGKGFGPRFAESAYRETSGAV